jgi:hypothetical protein
MKLNSLSLILIIAINFTLPYVAYSQEHFKPGTIITNDNNKLTGVIDVKGLKHNMSVVNFKADANAATQTFTPEQIKSFNAGSDYFVSASVSFDTSPATADELLKGLYIDDGLHKQAYYEANQISRQKIVPKGDIKYQDGDSVVVIRPVNKQATVFLQVLVTGTLNLYYLKDDTGKEHFYISDSEGSYEELNRVFFADFGDQRVLYTDMRQVPNKTIYEVEFYKQQLISYMDDKDWESRVLKESFNERHLVDLIADFNAAHGSGSSVIVKKQLDNKYNIGVLAGAGVTQLSFKNSTLPLTYVDFSYSPTYLFGGYGEIVFPQMNGRFSLMGELTARYFKSDGSGKNGPYTYESSFEVSSVRFSPVLRFKILAGDISPYVSAGYFAAFTLKNTNSISKSYLGNPVSSGVAIEKENLKNVEQGFSAGIGMQIKKLSAEGRCEYGNGYSKTLGLNSNSTVFLFKVAYSF